MRADRTLLPPGDVVVTGTRQRDAWRAGVLPPVEQVRDGLWSVPVPIPHSPLRYVLVYVFELDAGVALVDAGWDCEPAWQALVAGLSATGHRVEEVRAVLVTHMHPDHFGLAPRVREASGAWIAVHPADAPGHGPGPDRSRSGEPDPILAATELLRRNGVPEEVFARYAATAPVDDEDAGRRAPDVLLEHGDRVGLPGWELSAVWTPGHTPGHLCFHEGRYDLLLSGDHVLPRITPNISVQPGQPPNPLADYLRSLRMLERREPDEVLPGHEYRFRGLRQRVVRLQEHHEERLGEISAAVRAAPGSSCWQLTAELTWSRPFDQLRYHLARMAVRETLAHLVVLESREQVLRNGQLPERWFPQERP